jgi:hypothetical protein
MGLRFGAYEETYLADSKPFEASISAVSVACAVSVFDMPYITTLVQPLFFKGTMPWTLVATSAIGFLCWAQYVARVPMIRAPR